MKTPTRYQVAVLWIALNDEPSMLDAETVASFISVGLVADIFDRSVERVAADVVAARKREAAALVGAA